MSVTVEAIKFNYDTASARHDAFNLRRNATKFTPPPEWRRGVTTVPADCPVGYAIAETQGQSLHIEASFSADPAIPSAEVRAIAAGGQLGDVAAHPVAFHGGTSGYVLLDLVHPTFHQGGIRRFDFDWQWQYRRTPADPWTNANVTRHRVFITLQVPAAPWQQSPFGATNTQLPWAEVLEFACDWAAGEVSTSAASAAVTQEIYNLGPSILEYDCPGGGSPHYSSPDFHCTEFLDRLRGGPGRGRFVNCADCATFVSTFANVLGCDWWQSRMGYSFALRPILAIGSTTWRTACGWPAFSFHEVAWAGACGAADVICDACLQVSSTPAPPYHALLPTNMVFGSGGHGDYRDKLATTAGVPACAPQPTTRQRRLVV
jgi:hypothetical protein